MQVIASKGLNQVLYVLCCEPDGMTAEAIVALAKATGADRVEVRDDSSETRANLER